MGGSSESCVHRKCSWARAGTSTTEAQLLLKQGHRGYSRLFFSCRSFSLDLCRFWIFGDTVNCKSEILSKALPTHSLCLYLSVSFSEMLFSFICSLRETNKETNWINLMSCVHTISLLNWFCLIPPIEEFYIRTEILSFFLFALWDESVSISIAIIRIFPDLIRVLWWFSVKRIKWFLYLALVSTYSEAKLRSIAWMRLLDCFCFGGKNSWCLNNLYRMSSTSLCPISALIFFPFSPPPGNMEMSGTYCPRLGCSYSPVWWRWSTWSWWLGWHQSKKNVAPPSEWELQRVRHAPPSLWSNGNHRKTTWLAWSLEDKDI